MNEPASLNILSIQPFYGGSHRSFNDGWAKHSQHRWTTIGLPARHWKWRMRHASIYFAGQVAKRFQNGERWDALICSDMMNVGEFKGLVPYAVAELPIIQFFHENQFAYPDRFSRERDLHFAFTNFVSSLAATRVWFNSRHNRDSMMGSIVKQSKSWPDFVPECEIESLKTKCEIHPLGISEPDIDLAACNLARSVRAKERAPIHLVWAARWEHDKDPDGLLRCLEILASKDCDFRVSIIGESFREIPETFAKIEKAFSSRIARWGFQETRDDYWYALSEADVFISTAQHEFFGLSAAESIMCGLYPLLPTRLAYPELLELAAADPLSDYLYGETPEDLANRIIEIVEMRNRQGWPGTGKLAENLASRLAWKYRARELDHAVRVMVDSHD